MLKIQWLQIGLLLTLAALSSACGARSDASSSRANAQPMDKQEAPNPGRTPLQEKPSDAPPFRSDLELHGIKFLVDSPNRAVANSVTITPSGLEISNDPFTSPVNGYVVDAQVGDLNVDRSPEAYIFVRERGGLERVNVIAYGTNSRKSMSEFVLPEPDVQTKEYKGYNGKDQFDVVENTLSRRFPLFAEENGQMKPTGKTRIVQYKIKQGEATWHFKLHRFDDF